MGKTVNKYAKAVTKFVGGQDLAKYAGEKLAKKWASPEAKKYVSQTVSGKRALKSAANVASWVVPGAVGVGVKVVQRARAANAVKKTIGVKATVNQSSNAFLKRTYSGHEKEALRQAAIRNAAKKKK